MTDRQYSFIFKKETRALVVATRWILIILKLLLIPVLAFLQIPFWWALAGILAAVSAIEYRTLKIVPTVQLNAAGVIFKGMIQKKYAWADLNNAILKDGLLTIDFNDNRLFQKEAETYPDEQQFNDWCREKLSGLKG